MQTAGSNVRLFGQWAAVNCAASPTANAGQQAIANCKPLLFCFINGGITKCPESFDLQRLLSL